MRSHPFRQRLESFLKEVIGQAGTRCLLDALADEGERTHEVARQVLIPNAVVDLQETASLQDERNLFVPEPLVHGSFEVVRKSRSAEPAEAGEHAVCDCDVHGLRLIGTDLVVDGGVLTHLVSGGLKDLDERLDDARIEL